MIILHNKIHVCSYRLVYQCFSNYKDLSKFQSDKKWQSLPIKISNYLSNYGGVRGPHNRVIFHIISKYRRQCKLGHIKNYQNVQNQLNASIQGLNHRSILSIQSVKENIFISFFYFNSNLPKHVLNHYPQLYSPKGKMLRIVFLWNSFWEIGANVTNFLRLSHL